MSSKADPVLQRGGLGPESRLLSINSILTGSRQSIKTEQATVEKKILVIDDNSSIRQTLAIILSQEQFMVATAEDGQEGIKLAETLRPDLIITDINIPRMSGYQLIRRLRTHPDLRGVKIVAITGLGGWAEARALELGADIAMSKPFDVDEVIASISQLLATLGGTQND